MMVKVAQTMDLFNDQLKREQHICNLLQKHFQQVSPQQILYELKRYGLDVNSEQIPYHTSWWASLLEWASTLQHKWNGPSTTIYLLPAQNLNAVCFQKCICLFVKAPVTNNILRALLTHEYNHSCRLARFGLPETVEDYIVLEGLAQWAVRELHGEEALQTWTTRLSYEEALEIWTEVDLDSIVDVYSILFGEEAAFIPSHFGYTFGYRLIEQYVKRNDCTISELLDLPTDVFLPK